MATSPMSARPAEASDPSCWGAILLGSVFVLAGIFVLGDIVAATVISTMLIGVLLLVAGGAEIFQAFSTQHWRGFLLRLLIGVFYAVCGVMLIADPARASVFLTFVFALSLIASGCVRIVQSFQYWALFGPLLLISGIIGVVAGLVILAKWPFSGLWVLGLLVGIDLVAHGIWWIFIGSRVRHENSAALG
ncbi:MAG: HdeD family acid-resistance protein [Proteobacteria bacterium]|nr:HdeD family acid-resistance protein [Pseudomonadota bacterium]